MLFLMTPSSTPPAATKTSPETLPLSPADSEKQGGLDLAMAKKDPWIEQNHEMADKANDDSREWKQTSKLV